MQRLSVLVAGLMLVLTAFTSASPVAAITGNFVKDTEHPFVGLAVFYDEDGAFVQRCSGALLTPIVFLTAGHCTEGMATARVYFQQDAGTRFDEALQEDPVTGYPNTCRTQPCATSDELYNYGFTGLGGPHAPDNKEAGLIILDQPIHLAEYGLLAAVGSLDTLATRRGQQDVSFTLSGYGISLINPVKLAFGRERLMATSTLVNVRSARLGGFNLQITANPGNDRGGTCFGDSGGPIFYGGASSNTIVGVNSFVLNLNCRGATVGYRTDTAAVIRWILTTVPESEAGKIRIIPLT